MSLFRVEDDAVREAFLRFRKESDPCPLRDGLRVDVERGGEFEREMRFFGSMRRSKCKDPFPRIVSFQTERNDVVATLIRRAIRHLG